MTVGTHRRIRRRDVEALRSRTARMSRDQRQSLWLSHAVAGAIARDPGAALEMAWDNLGRLRERARGQAVRWLDEWERLMRGPVQQLLIALTAPSPKGRELRQNTPFAGVLGDEERNLVLDAWTQFDRVEHALDVLADADLADRDEPWR